MISNIVIVNQSINQNNLQTKLEQNKKKKSEKNSMFRSYK
jgi:hypothetical protein